jgi:outer membrane protein
LDVVAYSTFGDEEQFNQYFGISADESLSSGLSQTNVSGGYRSSGLELAYRQNFFEKMQVSAGVGVEWYSDDIRESALVGDDTEVTAELSVVWRFW